MATGDVGGFPDGLPESDRSGWQELNAAQRDRVRTRLAVLADFDRGLVSADEAAQRCDVKRSRFYAMTSAWRDRPSLAALGVARGTGGRKGGPRRLDPGAVNALQAVLPRIVRMHQGARVSELIDRMVEAADLGNARVPGKLKLREMVERELARVAATGRAGDHVRLDCCAVNLAREGGRPWILFACLDVGTQAVLGAALLEEPDIVNGYSRIARDALERIAGPLSSLPWAARMANLEFAAGSDDEASRRLFDALWARGLAQAQMRQRRPLYGFYLRKTIGAKLGRLELTPDRTEKGEAVSDNVRGVPWLRSDAEQVLRSAIAQLDSGIAGGFDLARSSPSPPDDLLKALRVFSEARFR